MSRMAALFLASAAARGPTTAEEAIRQYRAMTSVTPARRCAGGDSGEILVCGKRDEAERQRLPLPEERGARDGPRRESGERPAASAAPVRQGGCGVADRGQRCSGGLDGKKAADAIMRVIRTLVDPDGIAEPDDFRPGRPARRRHPDPALDPH